MDPPIPSTPLSPPLLFVDPQGPPIFPALLSPPHCSLFPPPQVQVLTGKDAGRQGLVTQVVRARNWVVVEGLNTVRIERGGGLWC